LAAQLSVVKEFADQPFVLLNVNQDEDRDVVKEAMKKGEITWRSWWDGGEQGPIATRWNASAWPTVYVIDAKGVIRSHGNEEEGLAATVRSLLKKVP
jgi:hypothetical protein